jgi:homoserine O-succinyltransferase/O-acetyltransferase
MPITLELPQATRQRDPPASSALAGQPARLTIGLVNNMPDAAINATERQIIELLERAGSEYDIRLRLFALNSLPRSEQARYAMDGRYHRADALFDLRHDGLIVTGAEPRAGKLREEAYWRELTVIFDWIRAQTGSTLFLCLAAHAAVLHWNAVERTPLRQKLTGLFEVRVIEPHRLVDGLPRVFPLPHSRANGLNEFKLAAEGYKPLLWSKETGGDLFVKDEQNLLVLLQGHLEYEADTLGREFRRDLCRYAASQSDIPPILPANYFGAETLKRAQSFVERAQRERRPEIADEFSLCGLNFQPATWTGHARRFYSNWLSLVAERKARPPRLTPDHTIGVTIQNRTASASLPAAE